MSDVSPEYHTSSPVFTTAAASLLKQHGDVRSLVESVLAADGLDRATAAAANRHAHAVASDQPPAFVGDRVRRLRARRVFRGHVRVNVSSCSHSVCFSERCRKPAGLQKVAGEFAHLQQEPQIATLRGDSRARSLKDLDDALRALVVEHRREHEQEVGRVGGGLFVVVSCVSRAGVRRDERAFGAVATPGAGVARAAAGRLSSRSAR